MRKRFWLNSLLAAVLRVPALPALGGLFLLCIVLSVPAQGVMPDADFFKVCKTGAVEEVRLALNSGANIAAQDTQGKTALMFAAESNTKSAVMKELLKAVDEFNKKKHWYERGKKIDINDVNEKGKTALMFAVENNSPEVVQILLNAGADASIKDKQGMTVLMAYAARDDADPAVMKELLKVADEFNKKGLWRKGKNILGFKMIDVNAVDKEEGKTALMFAAEEKCNPEVVVELLKAGADINAMDNKGKTALSRLEANQFCQKSMPVRPNAPTKKDAKVPKPVSASTAPNAPTQENIWRSLCAAAMERQFQRCVEALRTAEERPATDKDVKAPHGIKQK